MLREILSGTTIFSVLRRIDEELAEQVRAGRCRRGEQPCGGPLHWAVFPRKPRGEAVALPAALGDRLGLCCGWCRGRTLPPSVLFWDRKVYWGVAILVMTALGQQRTEGYSVNRVQKLLGVPRSTLARWRVYFRETFRSSRPWQWLRGRLFPPVCPEAIPGEVVARFLASDPDPGAGLVACLRAVRLGAC